MGSKKKSAITTTTIIATIFTFLFHLLFLLSHIQQNMALHYSFVRILIIFYLCIIKAIKATMNLKFGIAPVVIVRFNKQEREDYIA